ncbi:MAG: hypothetical protein RIM99_13500 [Cyclobacteriaceae bacterium]
MNEEKETPVNKWLDDLQQRSWEPEILLSGIVLYGMFKVPDLLDGFLAFFKLNIFGNSQDIDNLVALFKMGIYWLISGLILHLICRGIWIGMVGLSYTFPKGIRLNKVNYKEPFSGKVQNIPAYEQIVIRLEKISSALFSVSFMLFMSLIGGYLYFLILVIAPFTIAILYFEMGYSGPGFDAFQIWVMLVLTIGVLGLIDFVTLGYFRKFKWVAKLYWPLHRLVSSLTLSRFYRPVYYGMVTNFNKWAFFILLLAFAFISIAGAGTIANTLFPGDAYSRLTNWDNSQGYSSFSGYYDDQNAEKPSTRAHIPSDIINGNVLRLFVVANIRYEEMMEEHTPLDSLREVYPDTLAVALKNMVVTEFLKVKLNDTFLDDLKWRFHYKTHTNQRGFLTYINIGALEEGTHELTISGPEKFYSNPFATIPFYRDVLDRPAQPVPQAQKQEEQSSDFQPKPFGIRD